MHDVFVAHVEEDATIALEIALGLEEAGYTTWCYEVDSIPGQSYLIQTGRAVEESRVALVVISPHSLGSRQVTREVIRAHESGKEFIPVLRSITHVEFQNRQPEWREAIGAAASISIPREGVAMVLPRIIDGLKSLGILSTSKTNAARIIQIRNTLDEVRGADVREKVGDLPIRAKEAMAKAVTVGKRPATSSWFWAAIALLCLGFLLLIIGTIAYPTTINPQQPWYEYFLGILIIAILFIVPGVYCLRRGMAQDMVTEPARGKIPGWWWLLPIILVFVGGIISWAKQKDANWRKATNLLALGIILSVFWTVPFLMLQQSPVVSPALPASQATPPETPEVEPLALTPKLPYQDDFSDPSTGWIQTSKENWEFYYKDGEYHALLKTFDYWAISHNRDAGRLTDFSLEMDARPIPVSGGAGFYGALFRYQWDDAFYSFEISGDGYYYVLKRFNGQWIYLKDKTKSDFIKTGNNMNHLKVICKGSQIEVYVNGHYLVTVTDDTFKEGYVGMYVECVAPNWHVAFDNIKVDGID